MTLHSSRDTIGLPCVRESGMGIWKRLKRLETPLTEGANRFNFALSDLPAEVRRAWKLR